MVISNFDWFDVSKLQNKLPCKYQDSIDPNKNKGNIRNYTENCAANIAENGSFGVRVCPCCMRPCIRLFCWFGEYTTIRGTELENKVQSSIRHMI